ncbi:hypothetical protein GQ457_13G028840 [Hibiscus cannabinus]
MDGKLLHQEGEKRDVRYWSEVNQSQNGDSLTVGYVSRYAESTCVNVRQNDLEELKQIWESFDREGRQFFFDTYGDIAQLLYVQVDETMLQALIQFWNPGYCCFTLNGKDLMPTVEEYTELLRIPKVLEGRIYTKPEKSCNRFEMLGQLVGRSVQWVDGRFSKKGGSLCFPWYSITEIARTYPDPHKKAHILAVAIYGLVLFPRTLGYIDVNVFEVFNQFQYGISPIPAILAETFLSLNACRQLEGGRFRGCVPLLYVWIKSHFWKTPKQVLSGINFMNFSPLKEFLEKEWDEVDSTKWVEAFRNLQEQDLVWRVPWLRCRKFLYKCYDHDWLMLLGLWGGIGCAPLLVSRQFGSQQFEKEKGKEIAEQYHQALKAEKDNTAAWKRKAHDSKIRLTESQRAYDALEIQLNQSRAQYSQLEARVREQEEMIREFQARDEYAELQASKSKIEKLEKEVKDLWALVQTCQISIQVLEDIKQGGNDYWFTRLRDAAHRFQEQDKINEKIMNLAQDVAEHVTMLAREARISFDDRLWKQFLSLRMHLHLHHLDHYIHLNI